MLNIPLKCANIFTIFFILSFFWPQVGYYYKVRVFWGICKLDTKGGYSNYCSNDNFLGKFIQKEKAQKKTTYAKALIPYCTVWVGTIEKFYTGY